MVLATVRTLDEQQRGLIDHLRTLRSMMSGFQARVPEVVKDCFSAICRRSVALLSDLPAAQRQGIGTALN